MNACVGRQQLCTAGPEVSAALGQGPPQPIQARSCSKLPPRQTSPLGRPAGRGLMLGRDKPVKGTSRA